MGKSSIMPKLDMPYLVQVHERPASFWMEMEEKQMESRVDAQKEETRREEGEK